MFHFSFLIPEQKERKMKLIRNRNTRNGRVWWPDRELWVSSSLLKMISKKKKLKNLHALLPSPPVTVRFRSGKKLTNLDGRPLRSVRLKWWLLFSTSFKSNKIWFPAEAKSYSDFELDFELADPSWLPSHTVLVRKENLVEFVYFIDSRRVYKI